MKRVIVLVIAMIMAIVSLVGCEGRNTEQQTIDNKKTQLYVYNYDGGVGSEWLYKLASRYEELNKDQSFETGKTGVQVVIQKSKSSFDTLLSSSQNSVFFVQQAFYNQIQASEKIIDITDVVKSTKYGRSIESRLNESQKDAFTAYDGKYYVVPHYSLYSGLSYNKEVFNDYKLYFGEYTKDGELDEGIPVYLKGEKTWVSLDQVNDPTNDLKLCSGPNGKTGVIEGVDYSFDDGLPSSLDEFYEMCRHMVEVGVIPFNMTGEYPQYAVHILDALWVAYNGEEFMSNFTFSGNTEYVSGFNGDEPIVQNIEVTPKNGYYLKAQTGKLFALKFYNEILKHSDEWFEESSFNSSTSHTDAQRKFIYSLPEGKPIAMLVEGTHWYNEAGQIFTDAENKYPGYKKNMAFMPMPNRYGTERECRDVITCDTNSSFAFISARIKNDELAVSLAKDFLAFAYTDESLQEFTTTTGVAKGVEYSLTKEQYESLNPFYKSLYDIQSSSKVLYPYSGSSIFVNNQQALQFACDNTFWTSGAIANPLTVFRTSTTDAVSYFQNWLDFANMKKQWDNQFSDYYD